MREQGGDVGGYPASHRIRVKVRYTEERKGNGTQAKGSQDNLRKAVTIIFFIFMILHTVIGMK